MLCSQIPTEEETGNTSHPDGKRPNTLTDVSQIEKTLPPRGSRRLGLTVQASIGMRWPLHETERKYSFPNTKSL